MRVQGFKPIYNLERLRAGLNTLESFWSAGAIPEKLKGHYYLTWYALYDGNLRQLSKGIGLYRNTYYGILKKNFGITNALRLRAEWQKIKEERRGKQFNDQLFVLWLKVKTCGNNKGG